MRIAARRSVGMLACLASLAAGAAPLPPDAELEAAGARIGNISVQGLPIFDTRIPAEDRLLYRLANRLKIRTRASAIRAQLLFASGQPYVPRLLAESERNLRQLQFVHEPHVRPVAWHDGVVDIAVSFQNVWTLSFGPSFGRSGGVNHSGLRLEDEDLLGFGKKLKLGFTSSVDRNSHYLEWFDPNVFGSRWTSNLHFEDTSDGHDHWAVLERPFYALDVRRSYGYSWADSSLLVGRYRLGLLDDQYRERSEWHDVHVGFSRGLANGAVQRLTAGWRVQLDRFAAEPNSALNAPLPADRQLRYPYLRWSWLTDRYSTAHNLDLIDRTEDLHFGLNADVELGIANRAWQADRNAVLLAAAASFGWNPSESLKYFASASYAARFAGGRAADQRYGAAFTWYRRASSHQVSYAHLLLQGGNDLDLDHYRVLGGDNGLRGYPLRYQVGTGAALLRVEQRLYTDWSPFRLFNVGAAAFVDAGRTWGPNPAGVPQLGWLSDIGVGLRLGNRRTARGAMIHVDLATPLRRGPNVSGLQLIVATEDTF